MHIKQKNAENLNIKNGKRYTMHKKAGSVQFSRSVMSDSLRPHESHRTRPPCPSPTHVHRVGDAIQPSHPWSFPSPPASNPSKHHGLFQ